MTLTNAYSTVEQFRARARVTHTDQDQELEAAVQVASREVDRICGRRFYVDGSATARVYRADWCDVVWVDDISTATGLVVATDEGDDGTAETTWSAADYQLEPLNGVMDGLAGWPYTRIRAVESRMFPTGGARARVSVTAKWGWAAVPDPVEEATLLIAHDLFKLGSTPFAVAGTEFGTFRIRDNARVTALLLPYIRSSPVRVA